MPIEIAQITPSLLANNTNIVAVCSNCSNTHGLSEYFEAEVTEWNSGDRNIRSIHPLGNKNNMSIQQFCVMLSLNKKHAVV